MPEAVTECFPGVPKDCLRCPGLTTAAGNAKQHDEPLDMLGHFELGAHEGQRMGRVVNLATVAQVLGATVTEVVRAHHRAVTNVGRVLYYACDGVIISREFQPPKRLPRLLPKLRGKVVVTTWCGSSSSMADFLPGISTERRAWPLKKALS